jgi:hypothetical protein
MASVEAVEVRIGGKTVKDALAANRMGILGRLSRAIVVTTRLAKTVRIRAQAGDYATSRLAYSSRKLGPRSWYFISQGYADALGARKRRYEHSLDFHRSNNRMIAGNITGGMWSGLRVRNFGTKGAVIEFAGRSIGAQIKKRRRGKANQRVMVGNRRKSATVYRTLKVNVIQPNDEEIKALGSAVVEVVGRLTAFGAPTKVQSSGDRALARQLVSDIEAGRVTRYL